MKTDCLMKGKGDSGLCVCVSVNVLNTIPAVHEGHLPSRKGKSNMAQRQRGERMVFLLGAGAL